MQLHTNDTTAEAMGARAYAQGDDIHFAGGAYDPESLDGQWLIAHEVAHTIQQAPGRPQKSATETSTSALELEADRFADHVTSGAPGPAPALTRVSPRVACFTGKEHKLLGDVGGDGATYDWEGEFQLTHGDVILLSGDWFEPDDLVWKAGRPSSKPGQMPGTRDEVLCALKKSIGDSDPRFQEGGIWHGITFSSAVETAVDQRDKQLASENTDHFLNPVAAGEKRPAGSKIGSGDTYRSMHQQAINVAWLAGQAGDSEGEAMLLEATAQHFLTDSFSAGHVSTPRASLVDHWEGVYPGFGDKLIDTLVHDVAVVLNSDAEGLAGAVPTSGWWRLPDFESMVRDELPSLPTYSLGHLLSLVFHDFDNERGLVMTNDLGWTWKAFGDGKLDEPGREGEKSNLEVATTAVRLGCDDIRAAHELGAANGEAWVDVEDRYEQVRQCTKEPAKRVDKYGPEQLLPVIADGQDRLPWKFDSLEELWDATAPDESGKKVGTLIWESVLPGAAVGKELDKIHDKQAYQISIEVAGVSVGDVYPKKAVRKAVLVPLRLSPASCLAYLLKVARS